MPITHSSNANPNRWPGGIRGWRTLEDGAGDGAGVGIGGGGGEDTDGDVGGGGGGGEDTDGDVSDGGSDDVSDGLDGVVEEDALALRLSR